MDTKTDKLGLVWGAKGIAAVIDKSVPQTNYLLRKRLLPAQKTGRSWVSTQRALEEHYSKMAVSDQMAEADQRQVCAVLIES